MSRSMDAAVPMTYHARQPMVWGKYTVYYNQRFRVLLSIYCVLVIHEYILQGYFAGNWINQLIAIFPVKIWYGKIRWDKITGTVQGAIEVLIYLCLLYQISKSFFNICKSFPCWVAKIPIPSYPSAYSRSVWSTYEHPWYVTIGGLVMPYEDLGQHWFRQWIINWLLLNMNILLSFDGTKPLPDPLLPYHQWCIVAFTWGQFHIKCPSYLSLTLPHLPGANELSYTKMFML